jgi:hypothetical protein
MNKLIEEKEDQSNTYELPELDMSYNLDETYLNKEQFEHRFKMISTHFKWNISDESKYRQYIESLNHIMKAPSLNKDVPISYSMSLHEDYPMVDVGYNVRQSRGHPYITRTPIADVTEDDVIDALYNYRITKDTTLIDSIINRDIKGELFDERSKLQFLNYPDESIPVTCRPGLNVREIDKHNTTMKALHWGQRKLILSEIRFITTVINKLDCKDDRISLVYPGGAPGTHLMLLMDMFPGLVLYLWDPAIFIDNLLYTDVYRRTGDMNSIPHECRKFVNRYQGRIFICPELVDDDWDQYLNNVLTKHKEKNLEHELGFFSDWSLMWIMQNIDVNNAMFISDIRMFTNNDILRYQHLMTKSVYDPILTFISNQDFNNDHIRDMENQQNWYKRSGIRFGLLKCKIDGPTKIGDSVYKEYLSGEIMLQSWAPFMSTETRLFIDRTTTKPVYYNSHKYINMMKYFNKVVRHQPMGDEKLIDHGIDIIEKGLTLEHVWRIILIDRIGFDCLTETKIVYDFLKLYKKEISLFDIINVISDITKSLKLKSPIRFKINNNQSMSRDSVGRRNHFSEYFQRRLDYTSIRTDFVTFPILERLSPFSMIRK